MWRDAAALFDAATGADAFRRPAACDQMAELVREGLVRRAARFQVEILGLASDQAAIDLWRADRMPLPAALLTDGAKIAKLREALLLAEQLGNAIDLVVLEALAKNALAPSRLEDQKDHKGFKDEMRKLKQALGVMRLDPVSEETRRHRQAHDVGRNRVEFHAGEPTRIDVLADFRAQAAAYAVPAACVVFATGLSRFA